MLSVDEQRARYDRLEALSMGLAKEVVIIGKGNDPLLYLERRAYVAALRDAVAGGRGRAGAAGPGAPAAGQGGVRRRGFRLPGAARCRILTSAVRRPAPGPGGAAYTGSLSCATPYCFSLPLS